jgi:putative cardiolipin synthase
VLKLWFDAGFLLTLATAVGAFLAASSFAVWLYGRFAKRARGAPSRSMPVTGTATGVDDVVAPLMAGRPGRTGIQLLEANMDAYAARAGSARAAGRSIDVQYYLWRSDLTGDLLALELLRAADRGVRVRFLIDDINTRGRDPHYLALNAHPRIEVRVFNPAKNRTNSLRRGIELMLRAVKVTRRMHNKAWIVDGRTAVIGGRNIGDTYFDAARDFNSVDMDALVIGAAVPQAEAVFDAYWNAPQVLPIRALWSRGRKGNLRGLRADLTRRAESEDAARYLGRGDPARALGELVGPGRGLHWTDEASILSDPPEKTEKRAKHAWLIRSLVPMLLAAKSKVRITTAYFVPDGRSVAALTGLARSGVGVSILTNSLASTNQVAVHGAYARARHPLLAGGIDLFELKPTDAGRGAYAGLSSDRSSLHGKCFSIDGTRGFIGSFNFDLRSAYLNTEMGIVFDQPDIAREMDRIFARDTSAERSWRLSLVDGGLRWIDGAKSLGGEPEADALRAVLAWIAGRLPIRSQL